MDPHVLELLQRAAEELKAAQAENARLETELAAVKAPGHGNDATNVGAALKEDRTNAQANEAAMQVRIETLQKELQAERDQHRAWNKRAKELETQLRDMRRAADEEADTLNARIAALEGEAQHAAASGDEAAQLQAQLDTANTHLAGLQAQAAQLQEALTAKTDAADALETRLHELETARAAREDELAHLHTELTAVKNRRDVLNIEIGKVENERNAARARVAELEGAFNRQREELEVHHREVLSTAQAALAKEKETHSDTAKKLLESRAKVKELETALTTAQSDLDAKTKALTGLTAAMEPLQQQLEHATGEWRHADAEYAKLHAEMMVLLDQRDEARRNLDAIKTRFGLQ